MTPTAAAARRCRRSDLAWTLAVAVALSTAPALTVRAAGSSSPDAPLPPATASAGASPQAADADAQRRARRSFAAAEAHFRAGSFREALAEYKAGYDAAALPGFLINIAQCQRRLGDLAGALTTYRKFVLVAPDSPFVPQVQGMIQELEKVGPEVTEGEGTTPPADDASSGTGTSPNRATAAPSLAAAPVASSPPVLVGKSEAPAAQPSFRKTWWVVGGVAAAAVIGGTVAIFALRSGDSTTTLHDGTLGTLRR